MVVLFPIVAAIRRCYDAVRPGAHVVYPDTEQGLPVVIGRLYHAND